MPVHILGIRHHGPGSASNVLAYLEALQPDIILVEGPPEADELLQWANHEQLQPPVAILAYEPEKPNHSSFYPYAIFSPEWQAITYARKRNIPVRFMDLPLTYVYGIENEKNAAADTTADIAPAAENQNSAAATTAEQSHTFDPVALLAVADGFSDGEQWWEHMFEYRRDNQDIFDAVMEAMTVLRQEVPSTNDSLNPLREAWMRKMIRQAEKEMYPEIAVICGAWHAPALKNMPAAKEDNELLKGLPKVKVACSWTPWTYNRLSTRSGYGAGIQSPGWYQHKWKHPDDDGTRWLTLVAKLFREHQMDISTAHVMEAVRLSNALASLRDLPAPGLEELNEAVVTVLCNGNDYPMQLINEQLIISNRIGSVPDDIPKAPLQADIERQQKKLRLSVTADFKDYLLDLRQPNDLQRSVFLHRLQLLDINWGEQKYTGGKGTFKEQWRLQWEPALAVDIIDKSCWGNTVETAAASYVTDQATRTPDLKAVCRMLESCIPAELPAATALLIQQVSNMAATNSDVIQLMEVLPPLVSITRYGNVRNTDASMVLAIIESIVTRICINLPAASTNITDDAVNALLDLYYAMNDAILTLQQPALAESWTQALHKVITGSNSAKALAGYATRLLSDAQHIDKETLIMRFSVAMSVANPPADAAAWLEGFLRGSGTLLLIDDTLFSLLRNWVDSLDAEIFIQLLPLLRRTFAAFTAPERRQIGDKIKSNATGGAPAAIIASDIDDARAIAGIPVILQLLGHTPAQTPVL
ncbi:DUF5682 family protein [Chitinophaga sp. Cy-1792]|uniref:DUF5682 family protein n=1 Tax=Chitinophaga sp. Cy-1792 TaxID=2608339 RepID=UPI00141DFF42|nr:DUF5682 family protein [Chitinophaga sp. Cy-1792]NIG54942.1 hypothetical protein [Chitinophaga sp. Cy-1792]